MARARKPASLKKGNSETVAQKKHREEIEKALRGNDDNVKVVPSYLSKDEQIYYKWLIDELEISGLITNLDVPILEQTANALFIMRQCDDIIRAEGILIKSFDKYGNEVVKPNPAIKIKLDYQTKYAALCNQLGLSPAARASLAGKQIDAKAEAEDPVMKLLSMN